MKKKIRSITVVLAVMLLLTTLLPLTVSAEETTPTLILTEICFNPTFMENDKDLAETADVFEYVEAVNASEKPISLKDATLQYSEA